MALDTVEDKDLNKVSSDGRFVIALAKRLGWTPVWPNPKRTFVQLLPPDDARNRSPIHVPTSNINNKRIRALIRQVIHASPEEKVMQAAAADAAVSLMEKGVSPELIRATQQQLGPPIPRPPAIKDMRFEPEPEPDLPGFEEPVIEVSRRPFNASGGSRVTYESEYSDEVTFSDGTVRWECTHPDCDYSSDKGGASVSRHYVQKHGSLRMEGDRRPRHQGDDHPEPEPSHRETPPEPERPEGDRLAQWLQQFIDQEVARQLVDVTSTYEQEKAALQEQIDSLTTELNECRREADNYRSNMITVRDLMSEVIG